jgi:hypothetical protein
MRSGIKPGQAAPNALPTHHCLRCRMRYFDQWRALTEFTEAGHLEASNNYAECCMRAVAAG